MSRPVSASRSASTCCGCARAWSAAPRSTSAASSSACASSTTRTTRRCSSCPRFAAAHPELAARLPARRRRRCRAATARCGSPARRRGCRAQAKRRGAAPAPPRRRHRAARRAGVPGRAHDPRPPVPAATRSTSARPSWRGCDRCRASRAGGPPSWWCRASTCRAPWSTPSAARPIGCVVAPHGLPGAAGDRQPTPAELARALRPAGPRRRVPGHHLPAQEPRGAGARPWPRLGAGHADAAPRAARWRGPGRGRCCGRRSTRLGLHDRVVRPGRVPDADRDGLLRAGRRRWPSRAATRASARRCWRRWPPGCRWSPPTPRRCPRWSAARRPAGRPRRRRGLGRGPRPRARRPGRGRAARVPPVGRGRPASPPRGRRPPSSTPTVWPLP